MAPLISENVIVIARTNKIKPKITLAAVNLSFSWYFIIKFLSKYSSISLMQ